MIPDSDIDLHEVWLLLTHFKVQLWEARWLTTRRTSDTPSTRFPTPALESRSTIVLITSILFNLMAPEVEYHPSFSAPDADVVLQSTDQVLFRVHSVTLRTTCGFFRVMFSLPQPGDGTVKCCEDAIGVGETGAELELFLRIICCMGIEPWPSLGDVWTILRVAEKYDAVGVISTVRLTLSSHLAAGSPITAFAMAAHFGWEDEAKQASKLALSVSLRQQTHRDTLSQAPSHYLLRLFSLREERRGLFYRRLLGSASGDPFLKWNTTRNQECGHGFSSATLSYWHKLCSRIVLEFEERPVEYLELVEEIPKWEEAQACWKLVCCSRLIFPPEQTLSGLKTCLEGLPSTI
jgi:hypothetical protein